MRESNLIKSHDKAATNIYNNILMGATSTDLELSNNPLLTVNVSPIIITNKPTGPEAGKISNSHNHNTNKLLTSEEMMVTVTKHAIVAGHLCGKRIKANFSKTNVIFIDVDAGSTLADFLVDAKGKELSPNLTYTTLSCVESDPKKINKFRAVYFLDREVDNIDEYDFLLKSLVKVFPYTDPAAAKVCQMFYSGHSPILYSKDPINIDRIVELGDSYGLEEKDSKKKARDYMYKRKKIKKKLDLKKFCVLDSSRKKRNFNPLKLSDECDLFNDFDKMNRKIYHNDLLAIYSVCRQFEGGRDYWEDRVIESPYINDGKINSISYYIESNYDNYHECNTNKFLDDGDKGLRFEYLSQALIQRNGKAIPLSVIDNSNYRTVNEINKELRVKLRVAFRNNDLITLIKCPSGVGKTTALKDFDLSKTVIVTPNHRLNEELEIKLCIKKVK